MIITIYHFNIQGALFAASRIIKQTDSTKTIKGHLTANKRQTVLLRCMVCSYDNTAVSRRVFGTQKCTQLFRKGTWDMIKSMSK